MHGTSRDDLDKDRTQNCGPESPVPRATEDAKQADAPVPPPPRRGRIGLVLFAVFLLAVALHVLSDRFAPYTSEASLQAPVIGVAPNVSGTIVEVGVRDNQPVNAGDMLFVIDPQRFAATVAQTAANLADAGQRIDASTAALAAAESKVQEAEAKLTNVREQTARTFELVRRGVYAAARSDDAKAAVTSAEAVMQTALAQLEEARTRLGPTGTSNPQVQAALAQLNRARIDLTDTKVTAPVDGVVTNTVLSVGHFAAAGQRRVTIVDTASAWVVADIPENALTRVKPGNRVEVTFNVLPGRILEGRVDSIASGVTRDFGAALQGELARVTERRRWVRETQRIPVRIELLQLADYPVIRVGSRASVVVYTDEAGLIAPLAALWLRFVSIISFAF
jgi:multidrug resistance efflux pump